MNVITSKREDPDFPSMKEYDILPGTSCGYMIETFLGQGFFGKVVQCVKLDTKESMAVKILKKDDYGSRELLINQELKKLDPDKNNLVRMFEHFQYLGHTCLVLEMLDMSIFDFVCYKRQIRLPEIQMVTRQLLVALDALWSIGVVHADIKPDNIMLVDHQLYPFKVKLIDFSMALPVWILRACRGKKIQIPHYRAPEVILGLELCEAIDMWSLGCLMTFMHTGFSILSSCEYKIIELMVKLHGLLDDELLDSGLYTEHFYRKDKNSPSSSWKLITQTEYMSANFHHEEGFKDWSHDDDSVCKDKLWSPSDMTDVFECKDMCYFIWLLKQMLIVDPKKRIKVSEALESHFINIKDFSRDIIPIDNLPSEILIKALSQLKDLSSTCKSFVTTRNIGTFTDDQLSLDKLSCNQANTTVLNGEAHTDRTAADNNGRANTNLDDTIEAETDKRPPDTNKAALPFSATHVSESSTDEGITLVVECKIKKTDLKRIHIILTDDQGNELENTGLNDTVPNDKPPDRNLATQPNSVTHNSDTTDFVEVKTRKKYLKRIWRFFTWSQRNDKSPRKSDSDDSSAAENDEKLLDNNTPASPFSVTHNSDTNQDNGATVEEEDRKKPKKKFLKPIHKFFSRMFKSTSG